MPSNAIGRHLLASIDPFNASEGLDSALSYAYCSSAVSFFWAVLQKKRRRHVETREDNCYQLRRRIESQLSAKAACEEVENTIDYTLVQAQVLVRHGARTPINLLPNFAEARYDKNLFRGTLSHTEFDFDVYHMSGTKAEGLSNTLINRRYKRVLEGGIHLGMLTTVGKQQCYELGLNLKRRYMYKYKLLNPQFTENEVYMRSTYILRTIESLQGVVSGLYGVDQLNSAKPKPRVETLYYNEEYLYPNAFICECLKEIANHGNRNLNQYHPGRKELLNKITEAIEYDNSHEELDIVAMRDDLIARDAHSQIIPAPLQQFFSQIQEESTKEFVQKVVGKPEDRAAGLMLALGPFHHMLINNFKLATQGSTKVRKLHLYSSHDNMVMPLLVAMGCYEEWPPFACYIAYELYKHKKTGEYYIKVIYNDKDLTLPGKSSPMITLSEFTDFLAPFILSVKDWQYKCKNSRASIEAPPVEHSLHFGIDDSKLKPSIEEKEEESGQAPAGM